MARDGAAPSSRAGADSGYSYVQRYLIETGSAPAEHLPEPAAATVPAKAAAVVPAEQPPAEQVDHQVPLASDDPPRALLGFDRDITRRRFDEIRQIYETLRRERDELQSRCSQLEEAIAKHEEVERLVAETILAAKRDAHRIRESARGEAEAALSAAKRRAEQLVESARREAEQHKAELVAAAGRERDSILAEARRTQEFIDETQEGLAEFLTSALKWYERRKNAAPVPDAATSLRHRDA